MREDGWGMREDGWEDGWEMREEERNLWWVKKRKSCSKVKINTANRSLCRSHW